MNEPVEYHMNRKRNNFILVLICALCVWVSSSCTSPTRKVNSISGQKTHPHIVNIINFIRDVEPRNPAITKEVLYRTVVKQIGIMRKYKLRGTFLLQYDALIDPRYQKLLKALPADSFEIGAWWEMPRPFVKDAGIKWRGKGPWDPRADVDFSTGYSLADRKKLSDTYMKKFKSIFGHYPKSVGSWFIDAYTLNYLHKKYGIIASTNCKDQIGTDGYTLWGGYWNQAYYPSLKNAYMPAQDAKDEIPVPIFRMLGSDPIRQYNNGLGSYRQGVVTLEPVYKFGGGDSAWVHWYFNQFTIGEPLAFAYVQAGQENSFTWKAMENGYKIQMPLIARLRNENKLKVETLSETGTWFRQHFKVTPATAVTVNKDLNGRDRQTVWYDSRFYRANLYWDNGTLRFRDIHLFNENLASAYRYKKATSTSSSFFTLPFVDGHIWSSKDTTAGMRFVTSQNKVVTPLEGGDPVVTRTGKGALQITWPLKTPGGKLFMELNERRIKITMDGKTRVNWFLDLPTSPTADLPFKAITLHKIACRFEGMNYSVSVKTGLFSYSGDHVAIRIKPVDHTIVLDLSDSGKTDGKKTHQ